MVVTYSVTHWSTASLSASTFPKDLKEQRVKPAGEWNTYEITCRGPKISLWVNGAVTSEWTNCEVLQGFVGLEAEGYRIEFRNVKLKTLEGSK